MRKAEYSGKFYESTPSKLKAQIESCFYNKQGPLEFPKFIANKKEKIYGAICPHAGYMFSGPCTVYFYKELMELSKNNLPNVFIILGTNHTGKNNLDFSISVEDFETPLGIAENALDLTGKIISNKELGVLAGKDEFPHKDEHSIEVQLPFIQHIYSQVNKTFKIVPIIVSCNDLEKINSFALELAKIIKDYEKETKNNVLILASSDMTHYGLAYGFLPFSANYAKEHMREFDKNIISDILKNDTKGFYEKAQKSTICGMFPILTLMSTVRKLGAKKGFLLKYYTSGDVNKDYSSAVGYASIVFK